MAWEILLDQDEKETDPTQLQQFKIQSHIYWQCYAASSDPYVLY